jgi:hypothetical protein
MKAIVGKLARERDAMKAEHDWATGKAQEEHAAKWFNRIGVRGKPKLPPPPAEMALKEAELLEAEAQLDKLLKEQAYVVPKSTAKGEPPAKTMNKALLSIGEQIMSWGKKK